MKLNTRKIKLELDRIGKNKLWLAKQMKRHRQQINLLLDESRTNSVTLKTVERIGNALGIDPKDLII